MTPTPRRVGPPTRSIVATAVGVGIFLAGGWVGPGGPAPASAQEAGPPAAGAWNSERSVELIRRARALRASTSVDSAFRSYRADARGYVYFFLDRPDSDERTLVKADQVALEVYWRAPNLTRQRIVGLRDRKVLPTTIQYHLDHLTVVQDDFGDWIQMGDGDEVARVLHPAGPASQVMYDFLLADSLSLRYGGDGQEVRVYEIQVRPRTPDLPGFVGSVFLARDDAAIVRMTFTFTPASYVDPYLDYIRVSLDNALWEGRYWLPYRQEVELRREMPALDFLAGSIIRGRFEIGGYELNPDLDDAFFGRRVTSVTPAERESFPFERGLFDDLEEEGLAPTPSLEAVREQARQIVTQRALSGLAPVRLSLRSASDGFRYNRSEGLFLGGGLTVRAPDDGRVRALAGWAFGRERPSAAVTLTGSDGPFVPEISLHWDALRDLGPVAGASPLLNSGFVAAGHADYLDPWFARGMVATFRRARPGAGPELTVTWEDQRSGANVVGGDLRPVRPIDDGVLGAVSLGVPVTARGGDARVQATLGRLGDRSFAWLTATSGWRLGPADGGRSLDVDAQAGVTTAEAPVQTLFHLGGRGTVPGHPYRGVTGQRFALLRAAATEPVWAPWLGVRAVAAAAATHLPSDRVLPAGWEATPRGSEVRASVGAGLSLLWDVIRLDLYRGLGDTGSWSWVVSVTPRFQPWL